MEYLLHHGVKGMHWGVRRYQPYPEGHIGGKEVGEAANNKKSLTKKQKDTIKKIAIGSAIAAATLAIVGASVYSYKKNSYETSINLNSLKLGKYASENFTIKDDISLPKGSTLFRSSGRDTLRDGPIFLSINEKDKNRYISTMNTSFQMKLKTKKDFKIPSEKKQFDLFVDLLTNNKEFSKEVTKNPFGKTENVFGNREAARKFAENYSYENFITKMIDYNPSNKNSPLTVFANHIKQNGYDGIIDVNDIRIRSDSPIIALNKDDLILESSKKLNAGMKFIAGLRLSNVVLK